jgi:predicted O-methyltransferase YrrM
MALEALLAELEHHGSTHDARTEIRAGRLLNITRETGRFLALLVRAVAAKEILEIGTSNGYSTLWLASAVNDADGSVTTIEHSAEKTVMAAVNFARAGLDGAIRQIQGNAGAILPTLSTESVDLVFLDADRERYQDWWQDVRRVLRPGGLLVVDNACSHADELRPFTGAVEADQEFLTSLVPVGKGEFLAVKSGCAQ